MNQANLHPTRNEFKRRPTQLNSSSIGVRNQTKFAPNPSPIRIRISACTSVLIFGITFGSDIQSRWFKLGWKVSLKGYNFVVYQLIYSYTGLKKREDIWGKKKKEREKKKKVVQSSIYSNVLSCLVIRGIHYQFLLLRQNVTWNMSMQKHFKFVTCWVTGCIHHKCLHSRQKISDDMEKKIDEERYFEIFKGLSKIIF